VLAAAVSLAGAAGGQELSDGAAEAGPVGGPEAIEDLDLERLLEVGTVDAASRRRQSLFEAPADLTVLRAEEIATAPVDHVAELLRRVPGAQVMQVNGNAFNVGLRGINQLSNSYVLVLVDGRAVGSFAQGYIPWGELPLHPGDIERIEVLRGPGSTLYGASAFSGVIHIVTKRPLDHDRIEATLRSGIYLVDSVRSDGVDTTRINDGGSGYAALHWRDAAARIGLRLTTGFGSVPDWDRSAIDTPDKFGNFHYHTALSAEYRPDDDTNVFARLSQALSEHDLSISAASPSRPLVHSEQALLLSLERHRLLGGRATARLQLDGRRVEMTGLDRSGDLVLEERTHTLQGHLLGMLDLALLERRDILSLGVEGSFHDIDDFFVSSPSSRYLAALLQNELRLLRDPDLLISAAVRLERIDTSDGNPGGAEVVYRNLNGRAAVVLNARNQHSVRLAFATAYRTPTPFENFVDIVVAIEPPVPLFIANPRLRPATARSVEAGYRGLLAGDKLRLDCTLYYQYLDDIIDIVREPVLPFQFGNVLSLHQLGAELALDLRTSRAFTLHGNYAVNWSRRAGDTSAPLGTEWPVHIVGLGGELALPARVALRGSLDLWSPIDPAVPVVGPQRVLISDSRVPTQVIASVRVGHRLAGGVELFVEGRNLVGLVRDRDDLRQYVSDKVEPIGGSLVVGLRLEGGRR
jgi:outer membrane receptor protein involved in Fe transport